MDSDRTPAPERDELRDPDEVNEAADSPTPTPDPNDEIPVPIAMYPSEIDERAQVVEKLREESNTNRADELGLEP
jgi:hypothetical protein